MSAEKRLYNEGLSGRVRQALAVAVLCGAMLLTQATLGQTVVPIRYQASTFHVEDQDGEQSWFAAAFSLTVGTFVLPSGRVGDIVGHKPMVVLGYLWLCVWSLVAGLSHYTESVVFFDVCRAMQGIACAILLPNSLAILGRIFPPGSFAKHLSFAFFAATAPNGFLVGAIFTTLFSVNGSLGWPWGFYIMAITTALLAGFCCFVLPSDAQMVAIHASWNTSESQDPSTAEITPTESVTTSVSGKTAPLWQRLDLSGMLIGVAGLVLFNFSFNQALVVGWQTVYVYVLLIVGFVLIAIFLIGEARAAFPLLPTSVFSVTGSLILISLALGWATFGIWVFYVNLFQQNVRQHSALSTVATYVPAGVTGIIAAFSSAHILGRTSPPFVMLMSLLAFCIGIIIAGTAPVDQTYWAQSFVSTAIMPFGMDMSFPAASIILSDLLPPHQQGTASSLVNTVVNYSIALGLGFAGIVETHVNDGGRDVLMGYRGAFWLGMGFAGAGVACALTNMLLQVRRDRQKRTSKVDIVETP